MAVKSDRWITEMARTRDMIKPFSKEQVRTGISYGVSSYGYDISLSDEFRLPDLSGLKEIDPKADLSAYFRKVQADSIIIPAGSYVLARSLEYFKIPREVIVICLGKSTYARSGIVVNVTPFEPEWEGYATISLINGSGVPARIYANEGIAQIIFLEGSEDCLRSYADKKGKYQSQKEITLSKSG